MNLLYALILIVLSAGPVLPQQNDWIIVPGKRLGPIAPNSTRADLDRFFGKANVHDQPVDSGNGPEPATVIYSSTPELALSIFWAGSRISDVMICYPESTTHCKWHTENGITLGVTVDKLETLNGHPFQFVIWGSDAGGNITSWQAGKLAPLFGEGEKRKLWLTIDYPQPPNGPTPEQSKWVGKVNGRDDILLSSQDEAVRHLHPTVSRLVAVFSLR
jgi:hypothetical protein